MTNSTMQICSFTLQPVALKADQFSMLGHIPPQTYRNWALPCWLAFFFSSFRAHPPHPRPPVALPQRDCFASQCQHAKAGLASHNREALPLPTVIILTVLLSPHIICQLSHSTSPSWNQPPPSTRGQEDRGAVPKSGHALLPSHLNSVRSLTEPGSSQDGTIRLVGKQ